MTIGELLEQKKMLELELSKVELMSERRVVRNDLNQVNNLLKVIDGRTTFRFEKEKSISYQYVSGKRTW
jgi:hypothetical protein